SEKELFGVAQPEFGIFARCAELFAMHELVDYPPEDRTDTCVRDHVGIDQMVPADSTRWPLPDYGVRKNLCKIFHRGRAFANQIGRIGYRVRNLRTLDLKSGRIAPMVRMAGRVCCHMNPEVPGLFEQGGQLRWMQTN